MHSTTSSLRHDLKQATASEHASLEARIGPLHTQNAYNEYVRGLHAFRVLAETWLAQQPMSPAWRAHTMSETLHQDVSDLALTALPVFGLAWDTSADESFSMGVHYVLEGSALGARVLCKQVAPLGLHRGHGARHLWAQAEQSDWWGFLTHLQGRSTHLEKARVIAGANAAFAAAAAGMERARRA